MRILVSNFVCSFRVRFFPPSCSQPQQGRGRPELGSDCVARGATDRDRDRDRVLTPRVESVTEKRTKLVCLVLTQRTRTLTYTYTSYFRLGTSYRRRRRYVVHATQDTHAVFFSPLRYAGHVYAGIEVTCLIILYIFGLRSSSFVFILVLVLMFSSTGQLSFIHSSVSTREI